MTISSETQKQETPSLPGSGKARLRRRLIWGGRNFRFNFHNFWGKGLSLRRFSIAEAAFLLMLGLMASRVLGIVRQIIFNATFGTGLEANAYYAAARLPETLFNLIAGGALIHAFVPIFLSYEKEEGDKEAWRLVSLVFNALLLLLTVAIFLAELITPTFVNNLLVPDYSTTAKDLTTSLTRIMLLQPLILGLNTVITAVLNSKRQFLLPAIALAVYNLGLIGGLIATRIFPEIGVYGPTYGTLVAAFLQGIVQLPALIRQGARYSFIWNFNHPGLIKIFRLLLPNAMAIGVAYAAFILETNFASRIPDLRSLAILHNAEMLQALPVALIAQAVGQSLLPQLSIHATAGRFIRMRTMAIKIMGISLLVTIPAALILALLGRPTIFLLFQHGAFDVESAELTNFALFGYAIALPAVVAGPLIASGFFALKNAWVPFIANFAGLIVHYVTLVWLFQILNGNWIILAIPLSLALAALTEAIFMGVLLFSVLSKRQKKDLAMQRLERRRLYQKQIRGGQIG